MPRCLGPSNLLPIEFPLSPEYAATYKAIPHLEPYFVGDNLRLYLDNDEYQVILDPDKRQELVDTYTDAMVRVRKQRRGFEATVKQTEEELIYALQDWQELTPAAPIYCYDYHVLETPLDRSNGYTVRSGFLEVKRTGGTIRDGLTLRRYVTGFTLTFIERVKR